MKTITVITTTVTTIQASGLNTLRRSIDLIMDLQICRGVGMSGKLTITMITAITSRRDGKMGNS